MGEIHALHRYQTIFHTDSIDLIVSRLLLYLLTM